MPRDTPALEFEPMHRLIIGPRSARTMCGVKIDCFYPHSEKAGPADDAPLINCSTDGGSLPTCEFCLRYRAKHLRPEDQA